MTSDRSTRRTWPERASVVAIFVSAFVCLAVAAALVVGYQVARGRNIAAFENPADVPGATPGGRPPVTVAPSTTSLGVAGPTSADDADPAPAESSDAAGSSTPGEPDSTHPSPMPSDTSEAPAASSASATVSSLATVTTIGTPSTFPDADPEAQNFLITGADNGACIDPDSPYAGGFGDRESMGERSDTIMIIRVDPSADRAAVLSFPRDLWVEIADTGNMSRINSAYERDEPQRLADTIYQNFGIPMDHFIQVDFCAFKTLVNAVGGVSVPFEYPARDENTGLDIATTGCVNLDGDAALAYVRSRHYQYEDPAGSGNWQSDGTSDLGRVSRQQDFLRRVLSSLLDKGPLNPSVARGLINASTRYVVTDPDLTFAKMMEFAGVMNDVDPTSITNYQIEATPRMINGNSVLEPNIDGENMQAVLALFRGDTSLADAPVQQFETTTMAPAASIADTTTAAAASTPLGSAAPSTEVAETEVAATSEAPAESTGTEDASVDAASTTPVIEENPYGIVPPRDATC